MSGDLDLIRAFRAEDAVVDASSQNKARAALLEHIDRSAAGKRGAWRRRSGRRFALGIRADLVALALSILVVGGVGALFLSLGRKPPPRAAHHGAVEPPGVIRNFSPGKAPALPGRTVCTGELTPRGLGPGGLFFLTTCQFQPPGIGGSPHGTFHANAAKINGVNQYRFLITATGLTTNTDGSVYEVWLLQAAPRAGTGGTYRLLEPQTPRLLGVIEPGVGRDGRLAAEGTAPRELLGSDYLLLITLQPRRSAARPGRTVLHGFVSLPTADS